MFLDELPISNTNGLQISQDFHEIRSRLNKMLWEWFDKNKDLEITSIKFLFFSKKVVLSDLSSLFERIAGPRDTGTVVTK